MIYRSRTMTFLPEKSAAVRDVSVRAAAYVNEHYPNVHVEILENIAGHGYQIHMVTRCDSLAALEAYESDRQSDEGWLALVDEVRALQGVVRSVDSLYRVLTG